MTVTEFWRNRPEALFIIVLLLALQIWSNHLEIKAPARDALDVLMTGIGLASAPRIRRIFQRLYVS